MTLADQALRLNFTGKRRLPPLLLVTDATRLPDPMAAAARLPPGSGVVLRHYDAADRPQLARRLAAVARQRRLALLVAGDWRLAAAVGAAGLHLPEGLARHGVLAPLLGWVRRRGALLSIAAHSPAALARARRLGAAGAVLSPVFATRSHPGAPVIGPLRFSAWIRRAGLPVHALGGIGTATAARLKHSGAAGLAAIGALG
ncbi:MAG: thiamine phosphate synthase [Actinomycetota bacterium]